MKLVLIITTCRAPVDVFNLVTGGDRKHFTYGTSYIGSSNNASCDREVWVREGTRYIQQQNKEHRP